MILKFNDFINENQGELQKQVNKNNRQAYLDYVDNFDINTIPLSIRKKCYKSFTDIFNSRNDKFACEVTIDDILESIEDQNIESARKVVNELIETYGFDESMFKISNPNNVTYIKVYDVPIYLETTTMIIIPDIDNNIKIIEKEMNAYGYYKVRQSIKIDKSGMKWASLIFDPQRQDTITNQIRNHCPVLYHCSESRNDANIKEFGILAKNAGRIYTYKEDRVYLLTEKTNRRQNELINNIIKNRKRNDPTFDGSYNRYTILTDALSDNIEFYEDPHGPKGCIYITTNIPVESIIKTEKIR